MDERQISELLWNAVGYAITAGAALITVIALWLCVPAFRARWLPLSRLRPGTWTGHDVFLAICVGAGFPSLVIAILIYLRFFTPLIGPLPDLENPGPELATYGLRCLAISSPLTLAVTLGILFPMLYARSRCRPHHFGVSWARWPANVGVGLASFLVATPVVLAVYALTSVFVAWFVPLRSHPLVSLGKIRLEEWEWLLIAFQVTVVAPLLEEIIFRGILQGWLRRATLNGHLGVMVAAVFVSLRGVWYDVPEKNLQVIDPSPVVFAFLLVGLYGFQLYRLARRFGMGETEIQDWAPMEIQPSLLSGASKESAVKNEGERRRAWREANARLAIHGSAMLFATFHSDSWPGPIALYLLALVLGDLARRTQSLVGPITFHAAFNVVALIGLYGVAHYDAEAKGNAQTTAVRPSVVGSITTAVPASQLPLRK